MNFKDVMNADIANVFLNTEELAEKHVIELEGEPYTIPAIIEKTAFSKFEKQWDGVYQSSLTIFLCKSNIARAPIRGQMVVVDGKQYNVAECIEDMGMLEMHLEVPDVG